MLVGVGEGVGVGVSVGGNGVGVGVLVGVTVGICVGSDPHITPFSSAPMYGLADVTEPSLAHTVLSLRLSTELLVVVPLHVT